MGNEFKITDVVDKKAIADLQSLKKEFDEAATSYAAFATALAGGARVNPKTLQELSDKSVSYNKVLTDLMATQNKMASIQTKQLGLLDSLNKKMSSMTSMANFGKLFEDFAGNVNKASKALESIAASSDKASNAQSAGAQSTQRASKAMQEASTYIGMTNKAYTDIINSVMSYDKQAGELNKKLSDNKVRIEEIRSGMSLLEKEYKRGAIGKEEYSAKSAEALSRERELSEQNKQYSALLRNHAQVIVSAAGSYDEMSASVLQLERRYKTLGAAQREGVVGTKMLGQIEQLKSELKNIDAQMGNYQRNVGNYKSHWNGLGMSVQQVARELPSLAVGWNTFFLAISNNLPILSDELKKARIEFKEMQASGQKATPVWKQMAGAIFNWQTALVIGITILSVYGKEIASWVGNLFQAKDATMQLMSAERQMALARKSAMESSAKERTELDLLYLKLKDVTLSSKERAAAANEWMKKSPQHSNIMNGEVVSLGKLDSAYQSLSKQIVETAKARAYSDKVTKLETQKNDALTKRQNQYVTYLKAIEEQNKAVDEYNKKEKTGFGTATAKIEAKDKISRAAQNAKDQKKAWLDLIKVTDDYDKSISTISKNIKVDDLFPQPKEGTKQYWENQRKQAISALESMDEVKLKILESGKTNGVDDDTVKRYKDAIKLRDEANSKLSTYEDLSKTNKQIEKEEESHAKYMLRITNELNNARASAIEQERQSEIDGVKAEYEKKESAIKGNSEKETELRKAYVAAQAKAIADINYKYDMEILRVGLENRLASAKKDSAEELNLMVELNGVLRDAEIREAERTGVDVNAIREKYAKKEEDIYSDKASRIIGLMQDEVGMRYMNINSAMQEELDSLSGLYAKGELSREDYEKKKVDIANRYAIQLAKIAVSSLEDQLKVGNIDPEDKLALEKKLAEAKIALSDKEREVRIKNNEDIVDSEKKKLDKIADGLEMAGDALNAFADLGSAIYERKIEEIEGEQDANQEAGDAEIERITRLEETGAITKEEAEARKRAAEQKTAEKDKELAKKKADLQTKQAKMDKANAIVQSIIGTAVAIIKQLGTTPLPLGAPFVAAIAALGAINLATIIAQPIPKYAKGTDNHPGGLAVVGDGGREEMIISGGKSWITPSVPTLVDIPKGAVVLPDVMNMESIRGMKSDVALLLNDAARKGEPVMVNVNNDYRKLEGGIDRLNSSFDKMAKFQRKAAVQADLRNIANRL